MTKITLYLGDNEEGRFHYPVLQVDPFRTTKVFINDDEILRPLFRYRTSAGQVAIKSPVEVGDEIGIWQWDSRDLRWITGRSFYPWESLLTFADDQ